MNKKLVNQNILLLLLVVIIAIIPLLLIQDSEFGGADGAAEAIIMEVNADYEPWAQPILEPPGGETESLLFALQAALGAAVVFYGIGYLKGKSARRNANEMSKV